MKKKKVKKQMVMVQLEIPFEIKKKRRYYD